MKSHSLLLLPLLLALGGCASQETYHPIGRAAIRNKGEPMVYQVKDDDDQMDRATSRARKTVGKFIAALNHPTPGQSGFEVNKLFVKNGEGEHIWLTDVHFHSGRLYGDIDDKPTVVTELKRGERYSVNPNEVSDWAYIDNGRLVGGYTLRVLASEMSPQERSQFEKDSKFTIGQ